MGARPQLFNTAGQIIQQGGIFGPWAAISSWSGTNITTGRYLWELGGNTYVELDKNYKRAVFMGARQQFICGAGQLLQQGGDYGC